MPVTILPSPDRVGCNSDPLVSSAFELLQVTSRTWAPELPHPNRIKRKLYEKGTQPIIDSSFEDLNYNSLLIPYGNGMVNGIIRAFQQDLHLILRPDDVWLSILTQFKSFVNANANTEFLRAHFVGFENEKDLRIDIRPAEVWSMDPNKFAQEMTGLIQMHVVDVELRDWITPNFSTTTDNDKSVAAIVLLGTLQSYFNFALTGGCGFPSVTLLGERSDWEQILRKVLKLPNYGNQTSEWSRLLTPVISHMIASFDEPNSQRVKDFWLRACHSAGQERSGDLETLSGWITVFCFWSENGTRVKDHSDETLTPVERLILDNVVYPTILFKSIPTGVVLVHVVVEGHSETRVETKTTMVAGSVGMTATLTSTMIGAEKYQRTVQPRSGWWMLEDSECLVESD